VLKKTNVSEAQRRSRRWQRRVLPRLAGGLSCFKEDTDHQTTEREQMPDALCLGGVDLPRPAFRTADLKTEKRPLWEDVDDKMSYLLRFKETSADTKKAYYRVFAYARAPMQSCQWQRLFGAFEVKKVDGQFEDYEPFTSRLAKKPRQMVARNTIQQLVDRITQLEDEARPAAIPRKRKKAGGRVPAAIPQKRKKTK
jgi:hypothetical protein